VAKVITLLTDWGAGDPFLAAMKGVILGICPDAKIVDVSHSVRKFEVREGAQFLSSAYKYFPKGTVHVAVVDPGVGSRRRPLIIKTRNYFFVGPDNGLLMDAAHEDGVEKAVEITNRKLMLKEVSNTVHGRDIFAPAAAHLANGVPLREFGPEAKKPARLGMHKAAVIRRHVFGEVTHLDSFGNVRTNITGNDLERAGFTLGEELELCVGKRECFKVPFCKAYSDVAEGRLLLAVAGDGFLEISANMGDAGERLKAGIGERITLKE